MKFHSQVRTLDGAITSYVRVLADTWDEAEHRARVKAAQRTKKNSERYLRRPDPDGWVTIYLALHESEYA